MDYTRILTTKLTPKLCMFLMLSTLCVLSYAKAGCCSRHGGVAGCDIETNHQKCSDGTNSPSCLCGEKSGDQSTDKTKES
jgi:hypothetical protein